MDEVMSYWEWEIQENLKKPKLCELCRGVDIGFNMVRLGEKDVPSSVAGFYHPNCAETVKSEYQQTCVVCYSRFILHRIDSSKEICENCNKGEYKRINKILIQELYAARKYGCQATLTLKEWLQTLSNFNWTCAYCKQQRYEDIEHFIPVARGGGTTRYNCVPSCGGCNTRKGRYDVFTVFPDVAPQIARYLKGRE